MLSPFHGTIFIKTQKKFDSEHANDRRLAKQEFLGGVAFDLQNISQSDEPYKISRAVLADHVNSDSDDNLYSRLKALSKSRPGSYLEAVAAYPDAQSFRREIAVDQGSTKGGHNLVAPTAIFGWDFFVPESAEVNDKEDRKLLKSAAKLARSTEFIKLRADFYSWLDDISNGLIPPAEALADMNQRVASYTDFMRHQWPTKIIKRAIKIGAAFSGLIGLQHGLEVLGAAAGASLGLVDIISDDKFQPASVSPRLRPAAMFHDARQQLARFA